MRQLCGGVVISAFTYIIQSKVFSPRMDPIKIMIVAGEPSGDRHAAGVVKELIRHRPELGFFGSAGPLMRDAGVEATVEADHLSIVGVAAVAKAVPMFLGVMRRLRAAANASRPAAVILVDFPEFNLRLAKQLKKDGHRVIYYISPQLWGWRESRISLIRKYVDLLITILPFEKEWYGQRGVKHVEYAGHPSLSTVRASRAREEFFAAHKLPQAKPLIALLPGSRRKELEYILPVMLDAAVQLKADIPHAQFVIALASDRHRQIAEAMADSRKDLHVKFVVGETYDCLNAADAAAVTSGTATLDTSILGTPFVIVYKTSRHSAYLFRKLIRVEHVGLINLLAGRRLVTELLQEELTPASLSAELQKLLDPERAGAMKNDLAEVVRTLGSGNASERAAQLILRELDRLRPAPNG